MIKLENWTEITKGLYRYVVAASCCYEICLILAKTITRLCNAYLMPVQTIESL